MRSREQEEKRGKEEGRPTGCHFSKKAFFLSDSHNTTHNILAPSTTPPAIVWIRTEFDRQKLEIGVFQKINSGIKNNSVLL
jgi:hypothetical protein